jgi:hypothetical protein
MRGPTAFTSARVSGFFSYVTSGATGKSPLTALSHRVLYPCESSLRRITESVSRVWAIAEAVCGGWERPLPVRGVYSYDFERHPGLTRLQLLVQVAVVVDSHLDIRT